eukprot:scaffold22742_cov139-Cylindrotheca_fusiformis.AAC.1
MKIKIKNTKVGGAAKPKIRQLRSGGDIDIGKTYLPRSQTPNPPDVVSGRGSGAKFQEGNKRYWSLIMVSREAYEDCSREEKTEIVKSIMESITSFNGRFLQREAKSDRWFHVPTSLVLFKIKQALSQREVPKYMIDVKVEPIEETRRKDIATQCRYPDLQQLTVQIQGCELR